MRAGWVGAAPVPALALGPQQAVHGGDRAVVGAVVEKARPHLGRGEVAVEGGVQGVAHALALGGAQRVRRGRPGPSVPGRAWALPAVVGGPGLADKLAGPLRRGERGELGERGLSHLVDLPSESSLSESSPKSACAFPTTSRAALVFLSSVLRRSFSRRSRSSSTDSGLLLRRRPWAASAASAPASRALRHSTRWELYSPSRRKSALFAPGSRSARRTARGRRACTRR